MVQICNEPAIKPCSIQWLTVSSINGAVMGFFSNASHRPRALVCSMTFMEESVGPISLIGLWSIKPFDKDFTGLQRSKMPLSWLEHVKLVSFLNGRFTSLLKR